MFTKRMYLIFLSLFFLGILHGEDPGEVCGREISLVDFPILENFLRGFRVESFGEKLPKLELTGDVRIDLLWRRERQGNFYYRGGSAHDKEGVAIPADVFAIKSNLRVDFVGEKTWMVGQVEFDNNAGIDSGLPNDLECSSCFFCPQLLWGSGFCNYLCLKRCYAGMDLWKCEGEKILAEIGRRSLYYVFDSRIQFKARVDGIFAKYTNTYAKYDDERSSNAYLQVAYFLIDKHCNHFGYAAELGLFNPFDLGFDTKVSFINWKKYGKNECGVRNPLGWRFSNVQFSLYYNFREKVFDQDFRLYSAYLVNLAATHESFNLQVDVDPATNTIDVERLIAINPHKENVAWYVGFIIGDVKKQGDYQFDCNYQYVEAEAVPDCDVRGIGRGNARKESFSRNRRGNSNYKGLHMELLYGITDMLQVDVTYDSSRSVDKNIGVLIITNEATGVSKIFKNHIYNRFSIELIHAF